MYLLDDPIAAVDAHVAKHIYNNCIMGLLEGKTRVLCTHHTTYLRHADHVILMKDGYIENQVRRGNFIRLSDLNKILAVLGGLWLVLIVRQYNLDPILRVFFNCMTS